MAAEKHMESSVFGNIKGVCPCAEEVTLNPRRVDGLEGDGAGGGA